MERTITSVYSKVRFTSFFIVMMSLIQLLTKHFLVHLIEIVRYVIPTTSPLFSFLSRNYYEFLDQIRNATKLEKYFDD
jgi:hypothetical protein